jgi:hypothetical protein
MSNSSGKETKWLVVTILAWVVLLVIGAVSLANESLAQSTTGWKVLGSWQMNEKRGSVLEDNGSGQSRDGVIGKYVELDGRSHLFPRIDRSIHMQQPGHIDKIPDYDALDPGDRVYSVAVSVKYRRGIDRNIIQKGQGSPVGGMFKMKVGWKGQVYCLFRGDLGDSTVVGPDLGDGQWHDIRCVRTLNGSLMVVDGQRVDTSINDSGTISNDWPITIGGNSVCWTGAAKSCNYWAGRIGSIKILSK